MSLELLDYRRKVYSNYQTVSRSKLEPFQTAENFRENRDQLFEKHAQSALNEEQQKNFMGLNYFDYDPGWRKLASLDFNVSSTDIKIPLKEDGLMRMRAYAIARWRHRDAAFQLMIYEIKGYGGGLFLPFRDQSYKQADVYAGTRYLLDTIKGADLGTEAGKLVLDFNYAYNPSCAYNPAWDCPLAPEENWLDLAVLAGEKEFIPQSDAE
jgi:hypothetical protein